MANSEVGSAYVSIVPSLKGAAGKIERELGGALKNAAAVGATAMAALGAGIAVISKKSLDAYASYEQLTGGVETLFKGAADTVKENAANAYQTASLSANQYMEQATSFSAALVQSLDGDYEAAAKYADMAIRDMSDNANKMGTNIGSIQDAYQGFAKQNFTMLDNLKLGYGGTKNEMQRLLDKAMEIKAAQGEMVDYSIDSYADIVEAIHVVQDEMDITGTTALEAATTIEGSISMMKASWENWLVGLADENADIDALTDQLLESISNVAKNVGPRLAKIAQTIIEHLPQMGREVAEAAGEYLPPIVADMLTTVWNTAVDGLGLPFPKLDSDEVEEGVRSTVDGIAATIQGAVDLIAPIVQGAFEGFIGFAMQAKEDFQPVVDSVRDGIASPEFKQAAEDLKGAFERLGEAFEPLAEKLDGMNGPLHEFIQAAMSVAGSGVVQWLIDTADAIGSFIDGFASALENPSFQAALDQASTGFESLQQGMGDLSSACEPFAAAWNESVKPVQDAIREFVGSAVGAVFIELIREIGVAMQLTGAMLSYVGEKISGVRQKVEDIILWFARLAAGAVQAKENVANAFGQLPARVGEAFATLKSSAERKLEGIVRAARSIPERVIGFFSGLGDRISSAIGSIHMPRPHISWSTVSVGPASISVPDITWAAMGVATTGVSLLGIGEAGQEAVVPLQGRHMMPMAEAIADDLSSRGASREVVDWLAENLPSIIAECTPVMGRRTFDREARRASLA